MHYSGSMGFWLALLGLMIPAVLYFFLWLCFHDELSWQEGGGLLPLILAATLIVIFEIASLIVVFSTRTWNVFSGRMAIVIAAICFGLATLFFVWLRSQRGQSS